MIDLYIILTVLGWLICGTIGAVLMLGHFLRRKPNTINRADVGFLLVVILVGPLGLAAGLITFCLKD